MATQLERIAALETKVGHIEKTVNSIESKLDDLLAVRNKWAGVVRLAAFLTTSGFIGTISYLFGVGRHG